jgi:hypothetical protein
MTNRLAVAALILGLLPHPAVAQSLLGKTPEHARRDAGRDTNQSSPSAPNAKSDAHRTGTIKLWSGIGAMALGAIVAAGSSTTATTTVPAAGISASSTIRSNGQLVLGLAMLGGGGYLAWDGAKQRKANRPNIGLALGRRNLGVRIVKAW